ncbi:MAG: NAD(P)(+) transhydrogenase (Re/Si-specific) subunit alpha, partial [Polyangiaceae bacterium]|nr:NAD(P)(+) transhydrogenase (Re/Si-specific) subunit alpha [Polyangiaceae bacterium]
MVKVFVPRERSAGETRVAGTPETAKKLTKDGFEVLVESGAGEHAHFSDKAYAEAGAKVLTGADAKQAYREADIVVKVAAPGPNESLGGHEAELLKEGAILVGFASAHKNPDVIKMLRDRKVSFAAMELVPRISRAQTMDALSSQASLGGYKAALLAAANIDKYFPLLMTS